MPTRSAYPYALGAVLLWSTVATAFKRTLAHLDPLTLVWIASIVSLAVLGLWIVATRRVHTARKMLQKHPATLIGLGVINPALYYTVLFAAYDRLPAQEAQAINYTWVLMLALLSVPILHKRLSLYDLVAALIGYGGVFVIATHGEGTLAHVTDPLGIALALGSTLLWALYWLWMTRLGGDTTVVLFWNFVIGVIVLSLWMVFVHGLPNGWPDTTGWIGAIYIGLFEMSVTFVLWGRALALSPSTARIANLIYLSPPLSLIMICVVLGEPIYPSTLWGLGLILIALAIGTKSKTHQQKTPT
jgi:drug/metabolite transporter (DMT)-like permease